MNYLLDTCVISEFTKQHPHPGVLRWLESHDERSLYLSVVTPGEIQKGIAKLEDPLRQHTLRTWLDGVIERFGRRILPLDLDVMLKWGDVLGQAQRMGVVLPTVDTLIASTAQVHGLHVVSRNVRDLERCHAVLVNPWT